MSRKKILIAIFILLLCSIISFPTPALAIENSVVNLEVGWNKNTQDKFYFVDQGSQLMPYSWFLALEQDSSQELFRSDKHISDLRYLPSEPTKLNPDGLPIGFAKGVDRKGKEWLGFNCSLCHTGQISYKGKDLRIDGGSTLGDIQSLQYSLVSAMKATYENDEKFKRFYQQVLGSQADMKGVNALRTELFSRANQLADYNEINYEYPHQPDYGFGRVDAIGSIFNQVMVTFNGLPKDKALPSNAPVSYPFIWGTNESDVVQWPGFAPNGLLSMGTLIRNAGEVLGTFGTIDISPSKPLRKLEQKLLPFPPYKSSINIINLGKIERWVSQLHSPQWPEQYLPAINRNLADKGKVLYKNNCASCHQLISRKEEGIPYKAVLTPISAVKTDSTELDNAALLRDAGLYQGRLGLIPKLAKIPGQTDGTNPLFNAVLGALIEHPLKSTVAASIEFEGTLAESLKATSRVKETLPQYLKDLAATVQISSIPNAKKVAKADVYKARPLNGIWATPPYLHNGSIPNLYELLLPQSQRSSEFYLGSREFDPEKVGYVSTPLDSDVSQFKFDTTLKGNSNQGLEYGVDLEDKEKSELLEFLKTL
ncbi:MAG: di-heme-cytochrome C peroxidase [Pleurocapsa sp.]